MIEKYLFFKIFSVSVAEKLTGANKE